MNPNIPVKPNRVPKSVRKAEAIFVLLFFCIGVFSALSFFLGAHNTNDFSLVGSPYAEGLASNLFQLTCRLRNFSNLSLRSISVIGDAYDEKGRIIGTGSFIPDTGMTLSPSDTLRIIVKINVLSDCRDVRSIMVIPRSQLGTGRILVHTFSN